LISIYTKKKPAIDCCVQFLIEKWGPKHLFPYFSANTAK